MIYVDKYSFMAMATENLRKHIRAGFRKLGRDAVTASALYTMGNRRSPQRTNSPCGCFIGEAVFGLDGLFDKVMKNVGPNDKLEQESCIRELVKEELGVLSLINFVDEINLAVKDDLDIAAIYWSHYEPSLYNILHEEVERYLGYTIQELQDTVVLPGVASNV